MSNEDKSQKISKSDANKSRKKSKGLNEIKRFLESAEVFEKQIQENTGKKNDERVWDALIAGNRVNEIREQMSNPNLTDEEWKILDKEEDRALKEQFRALGFDE